MRASEDTLAADVRETHRAWLDEVQQELGPACEPEAGVWGRWRAVQYLEHVFAPRFRHEQAAVNGIAAQCPPACAMHLWALGELIELLLDQLAELGHMVQRGACFVEAAGKFLRAFQCWCEETEHAIAVLPSEPGAGEVMQHLRPLVRPVPQARAGHTPSTESVHGSAATR